VDEHELWYLRPRPKTNISQQNLVLTITLFFNQFIKTLQRRLQKVTNRNLAHVITEVQLNGIVNIFTDIDKPQGAIICVGVVVLGHFDLHYVYDYSNAALEKVKRPYAYRDTTASAQTTPNPLAERQWKW
jgi:hypothetical protein